MEGIKKFGKLLVEWGGVYKLDEDDFIVVKSSNSPVLIETKNKDKGLPLRLFTDSIDYGDFTYLNLFVDIIGKVNEKDWFYDTRSMIAGNLIKKCIKRIIEVNTTDKDGNHSLGVLSIASKFADMVDEKMLKELENIKPTELGRIVYSRPKRVAQLQTDIYDDDFISTKHIRKKTLKALHAIHSDLLESDNVHEHYKVKPTLGGIHKTETILTIMMMLSAAIGDAVDYLCDIDLKAGEFSAHMENLSDYKRECAWAATGTFVTESKKNEVEDDGIPDWKRQALANEHKNVLGGGISDRLGLFDSRREPVAKFDPFSYFNAGAAISAQSGMHNNGGGLLGMGHGLFEQIGLLDTRLSSFDDRGFRPPSHEPSREYSHTSRFVNSNDIPAPRG
jgi:uncharacterized metal-binding protein